MKPLKSTLAACVLPLSVLILPAHARDYKVGNITIDRTIARATVPGQKVGGGYMALVNTGAADDKLIGASADFAGMVEVHEMKMVDDVMQMNALPDGLSVPAGETVKLEPGGFHLMFMQLKAPLVEGDKHKVMLKFEKAGEVEVEFQVKSIAETMEMKMDHKKKDSGS